VNERFADAIVARYRPGDRVWIHDYQLTLVPAMLRRRIPDARIGFFLHIPFPAAEVFRILPWREQVLRGMLGADVVGFHTASYRYHFVYSAARVLGLDPDLETLAVEGREVRLGVHPISIDVDELVRLARDEEVRAEARGIRERAQGRKIVLGIDRLDYTKGIPRRMLAIERFLEREPELRSKVRFIQLAVPTREKVDAYADFRRTVNELVGRINGSYATLDDVPIHFLHRSMPMSEVVALYLAADVMMVTPLRDGMNLVCKEYVASRIDDTGALVLSEFAGAAAELIEALPVNPYDIDAVAAAIKRALVMPLPEQRVRMQALRRRVVTHDVHRWSHCFLNDLERASSAAPAVRRRTDAPQRSTIASARSAPSLVVMLDYDGTLRVTEQGEMIQAKFGLPGIAVRTLEVYATATLEATLGSPSPVDPQWRTTMERVAEAARAAFRRAVYDDSRFVPYFSSATPEAELDAMHIGSRPARRTNEGGLKVLRAIPWQFAWTQTRLLLASWLGVEEIAGDALSEADRDVCRAMYREWPFFRSTIDLMEMALAKADAGIAAHYDRHLVAPEHHDLGRALRDRLQRASDAVLQITGHRRLLEENPVLRRSIDVRNPYVDPINLLQVELLRRLRERRPPPRGSEQSGRDAAELLQLRRALLVTINGVAAGMRNTG
jgi:alpha,alpha-trehalose-phosphate synthase [UDP-forming]